MSCGHRVVGITNGHSIHAGPLKGPEFLSIYPSSTKLQVILFSACNNHCFEDESLEIELFKGFVKFEDTWMSLKSKNYVFFSLIDSVQTTLSQK
jgi:hypothetical protein